jgi:chemotaxis protein CheX
MSSLTESDLRLFVDSVVRYFHVTTRVEPVVSSAYLGDGNLQAHEFNGIVSFSGDFNGHVIVSMPPKPLRELLLLQHEHDLSDVNLLDAVGELANTLAGNARKALGAGLEISVPVKVQGGQGLTARVRQRPYVITLKWNSHPALICVDLERKTPA